MKLNLAVGMKAEEGYINTDIRKFKGVDKVFNLNKYPYPFTDNSFEEIKIFNSIHIIENLVRFLEEIYRIAKPNSILKIEASFFLSTENANDPYKKTDIGYNTFEMFDADLDYEDCYYRPKATFKTIKREWIFSDNPYLKWLSFLPNIFPKFYSRFLYFYFPSNKLYFELQTIK